MGGIGIYHYGVAANQRDSETKEQLVYQYGGPQDEGRIQDPGFWARIGDRYLSSQDGSSTTDRVEMTRLSTFADGKEVEVVSHAPDPVEAMARANKMLGEAKYNPMSRNCEHFANYVAYGDWTSKQARRAGTLSGILVASLGAVVLAAKIYRK